MPARDAAHAKRSLTFAGVLLLSTALTMPAMAQIEEVVVTAQKRTEDIQSVPIAVTAFTQQDLQSEQLTQFRDIQFHAPNVTYTQTNYGSSNFQIRGIGTGAIGNDVEGGVAINFDEVFLDNPLLTESSFYDLSGLEILAGPQSTLYGRGATGGTVNVNIAKPDLEQASIQGIVDYGNYDTKQIQGYVNLPIITDELAVRIAADFYKRDGFITNIYNDTHIDSRDQYSVRGTTRWQPTDRTTIDFTAEFSNENDTHVSGDKQLCTTDPSGVLGCLPGSASAAGAPNPYSTAASLPASQQGLEAALAGTPLAGYAPFLGLINLQAPPPALTGVVPAGMREVDTMFPPAYHNQDNFLSLKWQQTITPWLQSTFIAGYDNDSYSNYQSYLNTPGLPIPTNSSGFPGDCLAAAAGSPNWNCMSDALQLILPGVAELAGGNGAQYLANYEAFFSTPGALPLSNETKNGSTGRSYTFINSLDGFDHETNNADQYSGELRFATSFSGPLNAMVGFYYLHVSQYTQLHINSSGLDFAGLLFGALLGPLENPGLCLPNGCVDAPSYYHNFSTNTLTSKAVFGELYYEAIPDTLKFTAGLRLTDDSKNQVGRYELTDGLEPLGTINEMAGDSFVRTVELGLPAYQTVSEDYKKITGRFVADWTPQLDFTDQTLIYASFARGYKAGGANPSIGVSVPPALAAATPLTYAPEFINDYEVGTKNTALGNTLQANGDAYYYTYSGLQVSAIQYGTSINENIDATAWGLEGNLTWVPDDRWAFGVNVADETSKIGNVSELDARNPTDSDKYALLVKDDVVGSPTIGQNCAYYYTGAPGTLNPGNAVTPGMVAAGFTAPNGGVGALSSSGIPYSVFGACTPNSAQASALAAAGWTSTPSPGVPTNLKGNELLNTPQLSLSVNAQYTQPLPHDFSLVFRVDLHWQAHMWGRIFEDGADLIKSQTMMNASVQLNSPDDSWYVQGYCKNLFDKTNVTGEYLFGAQSAMATDAFLSDPRTYGIEIGAKFQ